MEPLKRVLVYLSKEKSLPQCAKFVQCITALFDSGSKDKVFVNCGIDKNRFLISDQEFTGSSRVQLATTKFCPIQNLEESQAASLPEDIRSCGVDVGVAVILETADGKVLLTRRAKCLTIFPNLWVPPGGHMELDEQFLDAGLRELEEETGLRLKEGEFTWKILGLWESVFPPLLSRGLPTKHHIVTYMLVLTQETHDQLQERLAPDLREVSACTWLDARMVELLLSADSEPELMKAKRNIPANFRVLELTNGFLVPVDVPPSAFLNTVPSEGTDVERLSSGTKYALRLWLDTLFKDK